MARNVSFDQCVQGASEIADGAPGGISCHMDNLEFVIVFEALQAQKGRDRLLDKTIEGLKFTFHRETEPPFDQGQQ